MAQNEADAQMCCAQYHTGKAEVKAQLLARPEGMEMAYFIVLEQTDETARCDLGTDLLVAREIFFRVVFGGVSACTLSDIVEDYLGTHF